MCGIAGVIDLDRRAVPVDWLTAMSARIRHRGPDDEGYALISRRSGQSACYSGPASTEKIRAQLPPIGSARNEDADIGVAHRRFSIVDLSDAAHQPFTDAEGNCVLAFNGEIYNYIEMREQLASRGVGFRTHSDTEVFLQAYLAFGSACFERLNGVWAAAIYDRRRGALLLSRDRLGKRPLYWTRTGARVLFASEIKALLAVPVVARAAAVNDASVMPFLKWGLRDLANQTCFAGIFSVPAAASTDIDERFPDEPRRFWTLPAARIGEQDISIPEAAGRLRGALEDAVRIRLRADVPFAADLSGGLDSSIVTALAAQLEPGLTTYTVKWPEPEHDESMYAHAVSASLRTEARMLTPGLDTFWQEIAAFTALEEEPYHSPNLHTSQAIRRQMRTDGVKMYLGGAGGDEVFAGYREYHDAHQCEQLASGRWTSYVRHARQWTESLSLGSALVRPVWRAVGNSARRAPQRVFSGLDTLLRQDLLTFKMPYWFRSGDKTHMGVPIESRSPLLDYRVIDLAFSLPTTYLLRDGWHKWILRHAMRGVLPDSVLWRRRKLGFPFPYQRFFAESAPELALIRQHSRNPFVDARHPPRAPQAHWRHVSFLLWYEHAFNKNDELLAALARRHVAGATPAFQPAFLAAESE